MSGSTAKFAILIPHYNQSAELDAAIQSCVNAGLASTAHLVVVDDGSDTEQEISELLAKWSESGKFNRVTLVENPRNVGVSRSLNNGLKRIQEPYFFRIDADDRVVPGRFEKQLQELEAGFDLVFSEAEIMYEGELIARSFSPPLTVIRRAIDFQNFLLHPTLAARTDFLVSRGGYSEVSRSAQDWRFWKQYLKEAKVALIAERLVQLGLSLSSVSNSKFERAPNYERTLKLRAALRYWDRKYALSAARQLGYSYYLAVFVLPNPYKLRFRFRLLSSRVQRSKTALVNRLRRK